VLAVYDGGAGGADIQWIGWSLELVLQVGQIFSRASVGGGSISCSLSGLRFVEMLEDEYGETGKVGIAYREQD
jgi:hypothetical protein